MFLCLYEDPDSVAVCPLSTSEFDPTLQAAPPWQHWEGRASTNAVEGWGGGWRPAGRPSPVDERARTGPVM